MPWISFSTASGRWSAAYEPGKTEAEIMAPAVERFFARGAGPRMMNILLSGAHGEAEAFFKVPGQRGSSKPTIFCCTRWKSRARADTGWNFRAR